MTTEALIERLMTRLDVMVADISELKGDMKAVNAHLARLNGSVAKHQESLNEIDKWKILKDNSLAQVAEDFKSLTQNRQMSDKTVITVTAICSATVLAIAGVGGGKIVEAVLSLVK